MIYFSVFLIILATFLGGFLALKFKHKLEILMAFSAGLLISLVFFEILPEIEETGALHQISFENLMLTLVIGFLTFHLLEKFLLIHACQEDNCLSQKHRSLGGWGAAGLSFHSFFDGLIVGAGFQVNMILGLTIALAVIFHKISDGLNISVWLLKNKTARRKIFYWLAINSLISALGVIFGSVIFIPAKNLVYFLAFFAGFFLYIGASDLLPEAHREKNSWSLILANILGFLVFFVVARFF